MRIAILAHPVEEQYAGVHIYTKEVIRSLLRNDTVNQYVFIHTKENPFFDGTEHYIIPNHRTIPGFPSLRLFFLVPRLLRKLKVDAVWEMAHFGPFFLPASIKRINTIHDLTPILMPSMHTSLSGLIHKIFMPRILAKSDLIISYSDNTVRDLARLYPQVAHKISMIPLGKDNSFVPTQNLAILEKYHIASPYILYIGTLEPRKNVMCLVEAYDLMRTTTHLKHKLVLAGKRGWKYEATLARIEQSPYRQDIILTDYVDRADMPALYTHAAVFVFPSIYEGFGLPLLEAMACGAPCISSNASSLPEVGGDAVVYFDPYKPADLALALQRVLSDVRFREALRYKSLQQSALFSWDDYAKKVMSLIAKLSHEKK